MQQQQQRWTTIEIAFVSIDLSIKVCGFVERSIAALYSIAVDLSRLYCYVCVCVIEIEVVMFLISVDILFFSISILFVLSSAF